MKQCMDEACQVILGDEYVLKSDRDVVLYDANGYRYQPERKLHYGHYQHEDGQEMWNKIEAALANVENEIKLYSLGRAAEERSDRCDPRDCGDLPECDTAPSCADNHTQSMFRKRRSLGYLLHVLAHTTVRRIDLSTPDCAAPIFR